jgi:hypothetical protein
VDGAPRDRRLDRRPADRGATEVYRFFAIVIGLLGWIYLAAQVVPLGGLNVVLKRRLWPRASSTSPTTEPDRRALAGGDERAALPERAVEVRFDPEAGEVARPGRDEGREA